MNEVLGDKVKITVIATGIDGNSRPNDITAPIVEEAENKDQISLNLDDQIADIPNNEVDEDLVPDKVDELHPLGDDEHFEIPAFIRKPKK